MSNPRTGEIVSRTELERHAKVFDSITDARCRLSLYGDGRRIFGQIDVRGLGVCRQLTAWDVSTGKQNPPLVGNESPLAAMQFQADGSLLSLADDGAVLRWDLKGNEVQRLYVPWRVGDRASLSEDGLLAVNREDRGIILRDLLRNEIIPLLSKKEWINAQTALSLDGTSLVIARENSLFIYFLKNKEVVEVNTGLHSVAELVLSPDRDRVALSIGGELGFGRSPGKRQLAILFPSVCDGPLAFSLDGSQVAVWSGEKTITLADAETGKRQGEIKLDTNTVSALAYGPLPHLLTVATGSEVRIIDWQTGKGTRRLNGARGRFVTHGPVAQSGSPRDEWSRDHWAPLGHDADFPRLSPPASSVTEGSGGALGTTSGRRTPFADSPRSRPSRPMAKQPLRFSKSVS